MKDQWLLFDGNRLHFTQPYSGDRVSLIFFVASHFDKVPPSIRGEMYDHGLDFDWDWHRTLGTTGQLCLPAGSPSHAVPAVPSRREVDSDERRACPRPSSELRPEPSLAQSKDRIHVAAEDSGVDALVPEQPEPFSDCL